MKLRQLPTEIDLKFSPREAEELKKLVTSHGARDVSQILRRIVLKNILTEDDLVVDFILKTHMFLPSWIARRCLGIAFRRIVVAYLDRRV